MRWTSMLWVVETDFYFSLVLFIILGLMAIYHFSLLKRGRLSMLLVIDKAPHAWELVQSLTT